jgi:hypothetical protein
VKDIETAAKEDEARTRACAIVLDVMLRKVAATQATFPSGVGVSSNGSGRPGASPPVTATPAPAVTAARVAAPAKSTKLERATASNASAVALELLRQEAPGSSVAEVNFTVPAEMIVTLPMIMGARILPVGSHLVLTSAALASLIASQSSPTAVPDSAGEAVVAASSKTGPPAPQQQLRQAVADVTASGFVRDRSTNQTFPLLEDWVVDATARQLSSARGAYVCWSGIGSVLISRDQAYRSVSLLGRHVTPLLDLRPAYARRLGAVAAMLQVMPARLLQWHAQSCESERRAVELPTITPAAGATADVAAAAAKRKRQSGLHPPGPRSAVHVPANTAGSAPAVAAPRPVDESASSVTATDAAAATVAADTTTDLLDDSEVQEASL